MPELTSGYAGGGLVTASAFDSGDSLGSVVITSGGSAHTKGAWTELIAATEHDANWIAISSNSHSVSTVGLIDIGIGAAAEQILIPDLFVIARNAGGGFPPYLFPVFIPKGSRITARWQNAAISATARVSVHLFGGTLLSGGSGPSIVSGYGATASSLGTNIDPGATANTWSAWTEMTAATDRDHRWLVLSGRYGDGAPAATVSHRVQIGIGAATEQVLVPDIPITVDTIADFAFSAVTAYPIFIPKGSRLTLRVRASVTADGDRDVWLRLYGAG